MYYFHIILLGGKAMIKSFYIKNYCSIKDRVEISFEASNLSDSTSFHNTFNFGNSQLLKVMSFYGANASGKSSIIKALAALRELVVPVPGFPPNHIPYNPFLFSKNSLESPTEMGIEFSLENNGSVFYKYEVSFNKTTIIHEKLNKFASQKPTLLFERDQSNNGPTIHLGPTIQSNLLLQQLTQSVIKHKTFISMFSNLKADDFSDVYLFFAERLINISPEVTRFDDIVPLEIKSNEKLKQFTEQLLKAADFDIQGVGVRKKTIPVAPFGDQMFGTIERDTLLLNHQGKGCGGEIAFVNESLGTKKIFVIATHLYRALQKPSVLIVDELESSLHPDLARLIVELFLDETINTHHSQLIFTSHNAALLDLDLFRREQINFVYKDKDTCSTYIHSLKDFGVRKTDSIDKSYLAGRYMTSPEINKELLQ